MLSTKFVHIFADMKCLFLTLILVVGFLEGVVLNSQTNWKWKLDADGKIVQEQLKALGFANLGCIDGKCFYANETERGLDFFDAWEYCHKIRLFPASILSEEQNIITASGFVNSNHPFWLPLTDLGSEGTFRWARTWEPATFTKWAPGYPIIGNDSVLNNCVFHARLYRVGTGWLNQPCGLSLRPLCEFP